MLEHFQYRKLHGSAITVFLTETCPCILRYAHKMSHAKPFPVPGSPAGPEPSDANANVANSVDNVANA